MENNDWMKFFEKTDKENEKERLLETATEAAKALYILFKAHLAAGFTEEQAIKIICALMGRGKV